jgi:hypothetical protein
MIRKDYIEDRCGVRYSEDGKLLIGYLVGQSKGNIICQLQ